MADRLAARPKRTRYRVRYVTTGLGFWTYEVWPKRGTRPIPGGPYHSWLGAWLAARREAKAQARLPDVLGNPFRVAAREEADRD